MAGNSQGDFSLGEGERTSLEVFTSICKLWLWEGRRIQIEKKEAKKKTTLWTIADITVQVLMVGDLSFDILSTLN